MPQKQKSILPDPITSQLQWLDNQLVPERSFLETAAARYPLFPLAATFITGILIQRLTDLNELFSAFLIVCALGLSIIMLRFTAPAVRLNGVILAAMLAFTALGMGRMCLFTKPGHTDIRHLVTNQRTLATIRGRIISPLRPEDRTSWKFGQYQWTKPSARCYLKIDQVLGKTGWTDASGTLFVTIGESPTNTNIGDRVQMYCWLSRFRPPNNPGQFDIHRYMNDKGVYLSASVPSEQSITLLKKGSGTSFSIFKNRLTALAGRAMLDDMPFEQNKSSLVDALLLGRRSGLDTSVNAAFQKTGLAHFISLSGMHVGILTTIMWFFGKAIGLTRRPRAITGIALLALYAVIVPARAPTLRAIFLCEMFFVSILVSRQLNPLNTLSLSALVTLFHQPGQLFSVSWQLSYATVFGILVFYQPINYRLTNYVISPLYHKTKEQSPITALLWPLLPYVQRIFELLSVGIAAWLGGAGLILWHFGTITPLSCVWTVLLFPFVFLILLLGFIKLIVFALLPTMSLAIGLLLTLLSNTFIATVKGIASFDVTSIQIGSVPIGLCLFAYTAILLIRFNNTSFGIKRIINGGLILTLALSFIAVGVAKSPRNSLRMHCLSVGHGQAIIVQLPNNQTLLFDAGSISQTNPGGRTIVPFLKSRGISTIDSVYLSHGDLDHINGLPETAAAVKIQSVFANSGLLQKAQSPSPPHSLQNWLADAGLMLNPIKTSSIRYDNVTINQIWPDAENAAANPLSSNDKSSVFLITYAGRTILLCGDIESFAQEEIIKRHPDIKIDVMVLPHHGSITNLNQGLIATFQPTTLIASCAFNRMNNTYKPDKTTQAAAFYTPINGTVTTKIKTDGTVSTIGFLNTK